MIKKHIAIFVTVLMLAPIFASAQVATSTLPDPGTMPDSALYFLKNWKEQIQLFFTFGVQQKAEQYLHLADVRLAEYQKMIEKGKQEIADKTLAKYETQLNRALEKVSELKTKGDKKADEIRKKIKEATSKHLQVLQNNLAKVPEAAKKGLENAIKVSQKGVGEVKNIIGGDEDVSNEMSDWKIYRNEKYGFEFQYPSNLEINEKDFSLTFPNKSVKIYGLIAENLLVPLLGSFGGFYQYTENQTVNSKVLSEKNGDINRDYFVANSGMGSWDTVINVYQYKNNKYYIASLYRSREFGDSSGVAVDLALKEMRDQNNEYIKTFNQILSTFKFISPTINQNLLTYTNDKYKIKFQYPDNWTAETYFYRSKVENMGFKVYKKINNGKIFTTRMIIWGGPQSAGDTCDSMTLRGIKFNACTDIGEGIERKGMYLLGDDNESKETFNTILSTLKFITQ